MDETPEQVKSFLISVQPLLKQDLWMQREASDWNEDFKAYRKIWKDRVMSVKARMGTLMRIVVPTVWV